MRVSDTLSPDQARALIRLYYEALDANDVHAAAAMVAGGTPLDDVALTFRDVRHWIREQAAEADIVATWFTFTGTHHLTGQKVEVDAMTMHRIADGTIAEQWLLVDKASLAEQLNNMTPAGGEKGG